MIDEGCLPGANTLREIAVSQQPRGLRWKTDMLGASTKHVEHHCVSVFQHNLSGGGWITLCITAKI